MQKEKKFMPFVCASWQHVATKDAVQVLAESTLCDRCKSSLISLLKYFEVIDVYENVVAGYLTVSEAISELRDRLAKETLTYHRMIKKSPSSAIPYQMKADFLNVLLHASVKLGELAELICLSLLPILKVMRKDPGDIRCFSQGNGNMYLMTQTADGSYLCSHCGFNVQLNTLIPPEEWYEDPREHERIVSDHPNLPFCKTCHNVMTSIAGTRSLHGKRSVFFFCGEGENTTHRLETYFEDLNPEEFIALKKEIRDAYGLYMLWDLLANNFPIEQILKGPDILEVNITSLTPKEKQEREERLQFMKAVGLITELKISKNKIKFSLDKTLLARKAAYVAQEDPTIL